MDITRKVSSTNSRFGRLKVSISIRVFALRLEISTESSTPAKESKLRSFSPCLNSDQPCLYRLWL